MDLTERPGGEDPGVRFVRSEPLGSAGGADPEDPYLWPAGERVDRFVVQRLIARGGMAYVYEALERPTGRRVAIKVLPSSPLWSDRTAARFEREIKILANMRHPNVVGFVSVGMHRGARYLVMEYVPGETLEQILAKRGTIPPIEAARIVKALARVLHAIHRNGIVHRDVKPSNIILTPKGIPKITDFGISRILEDESLTVTSEAVGTPFYMSPEQIQGKKHLIDARADVYSLGVILFELLTGTVPLAGDTLATVTYNVVHSDPPPPSALAPQPIPAALEAIVLKALQKTPARRHPSAEALAAELERFEVDEGPERPWVALLRRAGRFARANGGWFALAAGALLLGAGLAWIGSRLFSGPTPEPPTIPVKHPVPPEPRSAPSNEGAAQLILRGAEEAMEREAWWEARALWSRLEKEFSGTEVYRDRRERIAVALQLCSRRIREREEAVERTLQEARRWTNEGDWETAGKLWEELVGLAAGPYLKQRPQWRSRARDCRRELRAEKELEHLTVLAREGRWKVLLRDLAAFEKEFGETRTAERSRRRREGLRIAASSEKRVAELISEAREAFEGGDWEGLGKRLRELEALRTSWTFQKHAETVASWARHARAEPEAEALLAEIEQLKTERRWTGLLSRLAELRGRFGWTRAVNEAKERLKRLEMEAETARRAELEGRARRLREEADALARAGRTGEAAARLGMLLRDPLADTKFVREHREGLVADRERLLRKVRQEEARRWHRKMRSAVAARKWDEALQAARKVRDEFLGDRLLPPRAKAEVDTVIDRAVAGLTRLDMEGSIAGWLKHEPGRAAGAILEKVPLVGREGHALHLRADPKEAVLFHTAVGPIPEEARVLVFELAAEGRSSTVTILLGMKGSGLPSGEAYARTITAIAGVPGRVVIPLSDFSRLEDLSGKPDLPEGRRLRASDGSLQREVGHLGMLLQAGEGIYIDNIEFRAAAPE